MKTAMKTPKAAFDFLARPPRSLKPRKVGLTVTSDKAKSLADTVSLIETSGDIVDHMKIPDHVGVMWRYSAAFLKKKNALYAKAGIDTLPGGIPFEVAAVQGKVPQFMGRVAALGFKGVEVSEDSIDLAPGDRLPAIQQALTNELTVFTELGKKFPDQPLNAEEAIEMANRDLEAGTKLVVVEKSDVALVIRQKSDTLHGLMRGVGNEHLVHRVRAGRGPLRDRPSADQRVRARREPREHRGRGRLHHRGHASRPAPLADYSYFHSWRGRKCRGYRRADPYCARSPTDLATWEKLAIRLRSSRSYSSGVVGAGSKLMASIRRLTSGKSSTRATSRRSDSARDAASLPARGSRATRPARSSGSTSTIAGTSGISGERFAVTIAAPVPGHP